MPIPQALVVAAAALQAVEFVGLPECQLAAGPGRHLHRHGSQVQCRDVGNRQGPPGRARVAARLLCRSTFATPTTRVPSSSAMATATSTATITRVAVVDQQYLPEERIYYEPVDRGYRSGNKTPPSSLASHAAKAAGLNWRAERRKPPENAARLAMCHRAC